MAKRISVNTDHQANEIQNISLEKLSGDPAGFEGRIYANTTTFAVRRYLNGAWADVAGALTGKLVLGGILTPAAPLSGTVNNYTTANLADSNIIRVVTNGADVLLTGIDSTGIENGQLLVLMNIDSVKKITLQDNDAGSLAANRFLIGANIAVLKEKSIALWYDGASSRWRKFNT